MKLRTIGVLVCCVALPASADWLAAPALESGGKDITDAAAAIKPGAPRYQVWHAIAQEGRIRSTHGLALWTPIRDADPSARSCIARLRR